MIKIKNWIPHFFALKRAKKYFNSEKGKEDLEKEFQKAKNFTDSLEEERIIEKELLNEPFCA